MVSQNEYDAPAQETVKILNEALSCWDIALSETQERQYRIYASMLVEWNSTRMNLTRLISPQEIGIQHFLDSLAAMRLINIPENARVIDIGCGAGFPGIALKIFRPDINLTLMDSTAKKLSFCEAVSSELGLKEIDFIHGRAEDFGKSRLFHGIFNIATARAVAPMDKLLPWAVPFLANDGVLAAWKGPSAEEEMEKAEKITKKYSLRWSIAETPLPNSGEPPRFNRLVLCQREG